VIQVIAGGASLKVLDDKKRTREARDSCSQVTSIAYPILSFSDANLPEECIWDSEPLVIATNLSGFEVHRIFIDQGSSADIMLNKDLFAWVSSDMPGVNSDFVCHCLAIKPGCTLVAQKKKKMAPERTATIEKKIKELLDADFIHEIRYADWLSNVVMVKKANGKWRMCTNYTDLNKDPKDPFPFALY
jgi:hypothetical protein